MMFELLQFDFLSSCLLMAAGIGIDASIATVFQVNHIKTKRLMIFWISGVTLTHTLFPMIGYLSSYQSMQYFPSLTGLIGIIAFTLIAIFLYQEFSALLHRDKENTRLDQTSCFANLGILMAVSWDALWSGPAKSAQVIAWTPLAVWVSFFFVGVLIFFMTSIAYRLSAMFQVTDERWLHTIKWLQYSVIIYFALLAITRYTFDFQLHFLPLAITSMSIIAALFFVILVRRPCLLAIK